MTSSWWYKTFMSKRSLQMAKVQCNKVDMKTCIDVVSTSKLQLTFKKWSLAVFGYYIKEENSYLSEKANKMSWVWEPVLWRSSLSCHLQQQNPIWALVRVPATSFLIQLPVNMPWKAVEYGPSAWAPVFMWPRRSYQLLATEWPSSGYCSHLGYALVNGRPVRVCLCVRLTLPFK